jgi:hypothetical protein
MLWMTAIFAHNTADVKDWGYANAAMDIPIYDASLAWIPKCASNH